MHLRPLLVSRDASTPIVAAATEALGSSCDLSSSTVFQVLALLSHDAPEVRSAAAAALRSFGDAAALYLANPVGLHSAEERIHAQLLLSLMEGSALPESEDLVHRFSAQQETIEEIDRETLNKESEMPFLAHLWEFRKGIMIATLLTFAGGLAGVLLSDQFWPFLSIIYDVPISALSVYLPPAPFSTQIFFLLAATWVSLPVTIWQLEKFARPGLYLRERRMTRHLLISIVVALIATPLIAAAVARLLHVLATMSALFPEDTASIIWLTNRLTVGIVIIGFWIISFRPIWKWLSLQARARYVLKLTIGQPVLRPTAFSDLLRRGIVWTALTSLIVFSLLPIYLTGSLIIGFLLIALFLISMPHFLFRPVKDKASPSVSSFLDEFLQAFIPAGVGVWWLAIMLALLIFEHPIIETMNRLIHYKAGLVIAHQPFENALAPWFTYVSTVWIALAMNALAGLGYYLIRQRTQAKLREVAARLISLFFILSPLVFAIQYWPMLDDLGMRLQWPSETMHWLNIRLALTTSFILIGIVLLLFIKKAISHVSLKTIGTTIFLSFFLALLPTPILAAFVTVFAVPIRPYTE